VLQQAHGRAAALPQQRGEKPLWAGPRAGTRRAARHDVNNPNSGGVMKKCGMKYEGTMRQADINNQGICDFSEYGILAEDYFGGKQAEK